MRVTFVPSGKEVDLAPGQSLFEAARGLGLSVDTACMAKGTCGLCRIRVVAGEEHLNPYSQVESKHLGNVYFLTKVRLACQTRMAQGATAPGAHATIEIKNAPK